MFLTPSIPADLLIVMIVGLMVVHSVKLISARRWLLFDPLNTFWAGIFIVYVIQPISFAKTLISWHHNGVFEETLLWIFIGLLCVVIGYEYDIGPIRARIIPRCPDRLTPSRLAFSGYLLLGVGLVGYLFLFASAGGAANWLAVGRGGTDYANINGYMALLTNYLPLGAVLLLFHASFHNVIKLKKTLIWSLGCLLWLWFVYLGTRSQTIMFTLMLLAAYYLPRRSRPPGWLLVGGFIFIFMLVSFQAQYRDKFTNLSFNLKSIDLEEAYRRTAPGFLGGDREIQTENVSRGIDFNCVMSVVELVPESVPYNYGYGHLEVFTRIVPRAVWPNKIYPGMEAVQGVLLRANLADAYVRETALIMGPAFTFAGHWYYVGGPLGIIFGGLITGSLLRIIRNVYDRSVRSEGDIILYSALIQIGFVEAAATPWGWIYTLPLTLLPLMVLFVLCKARKKRKALILNPGRIICRSRTMGEQ